VSAGLGLSQVRVDYPRSGRVLDLELLELQPGRITVVAGPSGSGKSTLGHALCGLLPFLGARARGEACFAAGRVPIGARRPWLGVRGRAVRWIPQEPAGAFTTTRPLLPQLLEGTLSSPEQETRLARLLKVLGLPTTEELRGRRPFELSGGMLQRAALVSAFLPLPELVVADEPSSFLDPPRTLTLARIITALARDAGSAVLWITHDLRLAAAVADRVVLLEEGKVVEDGLPGPVLVPTGERSHALVRASARMALPL
jgi:ABC-type glutathione transport system ATPase component